MSQPSPSESTIRLFGDPIKRARALIPQRTPEEQAIRQAQLQKLVEEQQEAERPLCTFCNTKKVQGKYPDWIHRRLDCGDAHCADGNKEAEIRERLIRGGVPKRYITASLSDFGNRFASFDPAAKRDGLLIQGKEPGIGKTHLSAALFRRYGGEGLWTTVPELLLKIRATFREGARNSEEEIANKYGQAALVVLDDLGAEKVTDWSLSVLCVIVNRRLNDCRPTIVTTNLTLAEIEAFDTRLASRLGSFERIKLDGKDRRLSP